MTTCGPHLSLGRSVDNLNPLPSGCTVVVAIPACNEADHIPGCLAALATQRDGAGAPLEPGRFAVLVFANNCQDGTAERARSGQAFCPFPLIVVEAALPPDQSNAGWARKHAMDAAANLLGASGAGLILTTDADSRVCSTWLSRIEAEIAGGADAVAGYIEAEPTEFVALGPAFTGRGRLEDSYLALMAEVSALCDPLPHDPWPNHRVASGANLAVTLHAYRTIGGLPPRPVGEDVALAEALVTSGFKLRHALDIVVTTSCRLEGRAAGGAADTMRQRRDDPDAPCDADMELPRAVVQRGAWKRRLQSWHGSNQPFSRAWSRRLGLEEQAVATLAHASPIFEAFWRVVERESPALRRGAPLRPSELPPALAVLRRATRQLRRTLNPPKIDPPLASRGAHR